METDLPYYNKVFNYKKYVMINDTIKKYEIQDLHENSFGKKIVDGGKNFTINLRDIIKYNGIENKP